MALQGKTIFHFECGEHHFNVNTIIILDNAEAKVEFDKVETIFLIPYIGLPSVIFDRKLKRLLKDYYCIDVGRSSLS